MAPAPINAIIKCKGGDGYTFSYPCTISDVSAAYWIFPDGNSDVVFPSNHGNIAIIDIVLSGTGTDCTRDDIFVGGKSTGEQVLRSSNLGNNFSRQYTMASPMIIAPASRLRFVQKT